MYKITFVLLAIKILFFINFQVNETKKRNIIDDNYVINGDLHENNNGNHTTRYERADSIESRLTMYTTSPSPLDEGNYLMMVLIFTKFLVFFCVFSKTDNVIKAF